MATAPNNAAPSAVPAGPAAPRRDPTKTLLDEVLERTCEYIPFMEEEAIKLTVKIVKAMLCKPTKSGKVCDDHQANKFIMLCRSRRLNPFVGDAYIVGYDTKDGPEFNLVTAHQAYLKRAEAHPQFDGMKSGVLVQTPDGEVTDREGGFVFHGEVLLAGWATVFRRDRSIPAYRCLQLGGYRKDFGRWRDDPQGMIVKCAESAALRLAFPNNLAGTISDVELAPPRGSSSLTVDSGPRFAGWKSKSTLPAGQAGLTEEQLDRVQDAIREHGWDEVSLAALMQDRFGTELLSRIPAARFAELMRLIEGKDDGGDPGEP